jgi:hypothetical protein
MLKRFVLLHAVVFFFPAQPAAAVFSSMALPLSPSDVLPEAWFFLLRPPPPLQSPPGRPVLSSHLWSLFEALTVLFICSFVSHKPVLPPMPVLCCRAFCFFFPYGLCMKPCVYLPLQTINRSPPLHLLSPESFVTPSRPPQC